MGAAGILRTGRVGRRPPPTDVRPELAATAVAVALVIAYLAAGRMGGDLSAQMARADFARTNPFTPVDLRWFGGFLPFGYSLWAPALMALIGVRVTGALATVAATWLTARLLRTSGARRPMIGGIVAAVTLTSNLAEGRVSFACGVACGLGALALCGYRSHHGRAGWTRVAAGALAFLAGTASPVAALLLGVCAVALLAGHRLLDAAVVLVPAAVPAALLSLVFSDPGRGLFSPNDAFRAIGISLLVAAAVPLRLVRVGALVGAAMVLGVYLVPDPIGVSSARLTLLFALPVLVAFVHLPRLLVPVLVIVAVLVQSPVTIGTLRVAGRPATTAAYYRPLLAELESRGAVTGRVEVPELTGHWEAAYLARDVPLSRGWIRQTDIGQNDDVFYAHSPTSATYQQFLQRTTTQYVAVSDAPETFYGRRESRLISTGLPYLQEIWRDPHWTLYAVRDATPIVAAPGNLTSSNAADLTLTAPPNTQIHLRIRWFSWLSLSGAPPGACISHDGDDVVLHTGSQAADYTISSSLPDGSGHCG